MAWRIFKFVFVFALLLRVAYPGQADFSSDGKPQEPEIRIISSNSERIIIEMSVPGYQIEKIITEDQIYDTVRIPGHSQSPDVGKPQVPVVGTLLGIPPTGEYSLDILSIESQVLDGNYQLAPAPRPVLGEDEFAAGEWQYTKDQTAYSTDQAYPNTEARVGDEAWMRDQRLVRIEFFPFQYHARSGKLTWNTIIKVVIKFSGSVELSSNKHKSANSSMSNPFETVFASNLLNYEQASDWRIIPELTNRYNLTSELGTTFLNDGSDLLGPRIRIPVTADGIYQISYETLADPKLGFDVSQDPRYFRLDSQGREISIYVHNNDGDASKFSAGEYIQFYGQKFYGDFLANEHYQDEDIEWLETFYPIGGPEINFDAEFNAEMLEKYTDENVYWLSIQDVEGQRIGNVPIPTSVLGDVSSYTETIRNEESHYWKTITFSGEDTWFWDYVNVNAYSPVITRTYTTNLSAISEDSFIPSIHVDVVALSFNEYYPDDHHVQFYFNDPGHENLLYEAFWDGRSKLSVDFNIPLTSLREGENNLDMVTYKTQYMSSDAIYFNYFDIDYKRNLQAINDQIIFTNQTPGAWTFNVTGFTNTESINVLDITDPINPSMIDFTHGVSSLSFDFEHASTATVIAGKITSLTTDQLSIYTPPDFSNETEYILITHERFLATAEILSFYRKTNGISSQVIDINDLYNQFNFGIYHPIAIKNFLRYAFNNWSVKPSYVVLVGDGHWNFKGYTSPQSYGGYDKSTIYIPPNLAWVDPWKGETDTSNLLAAIVGDDPLPDLMISKLPVNGVDELISIIDKIATYEMDRTGIWRANHIFVADDTTTNYAGDFVGYADAIIDKYLYGRYSSVRIYQDDYECNENNSSNCYKVTDRLIHEMNNEGALILNYIGHGSIASWSNESILKDDDIANMQNGNKLPVLLSMTCWDGYYIYPGSESLVEQMLRADNKGIIAGFSPTGLGVASGHDFLHHGFYNELVNNGEHRLGVLTIAAKLNLYQSKRDFDLLNTFTLFGDPALYVQPMSKINLPIILHNN